MYNSNGHSRIIKLQTIPLVNNIPKGKAEVCRQFELLILLDFGHLSEWQVWTAVRMANIAYWPR